MQQRPAMKFTVCGFAGKDDWQALQKKQEAELKSVTGNEAVAKSPAVAAKPLLKEKALVALAQSRSDKVRLRLLNHYKIEAARLPSCFPRYAEDESGRVSFSLL